MGSITTTGEPREGADELSSHHNEYTKAFLDAHLIEHAADWKRKQELLAKWGIS